MNTTTIQARRKLIVIVLLCFAVGGAIVRQLSEPGVVRNIGTLLMLLWLPIIGNVIAWLVARVRRPVAAEPAGPGFAPGSAFQPHALVELTLRAAPIPAEDTLVPEGEHRCALVVDDQGFSARWWVPAGGEFRRGTAQTLQVEFLAPAVALPRFAPDAPFRMLVGEAFIGDGRVVRLLPPPPAPAPAPTL